MCTRLISLIRDGNRLAISIVVVIILLFATYFLSLQSSSMTEDFGIEENEARGSSVSIKELEGIDKTSRNGDKGKNGKDTKNKNDRNAKDNDSDDAMQLEAPRTSNIPYNYINDDENEQYFMYLPNGGFSNQRWCLENAILIAEVTNRTLYVPMAGRHSTGWYNFKKLKAETDMFPMDKIFDFPYLAECGVPLVPLNISLDDMEHKLRDYIHARPKGEVSFSVIVPESNEAAKTLNWEDAQSYKRIYKNDKFLYFRGPGMYHHWFPSQRTLEIRNMIRFSPFLRSIAIDIITRKLGGARKYNAVHIRRGDYFGAGWEGHSTPEAEDYLKDLQEAHANRSMPLFIATEPTKIRSWFHPILKYYKKSLFSPDLGEDVTKFRRMFPPKARSDFEGILDILICTCAKKFVPSTYSTFSLWISFMRRKRDTMFPECVAATESDNDDE